MIRNIQLKSITQSCKSLVYTTYTFWTQKTLTKQEAWNKTDTIKGDGLFWHKSLKNLKTWKIQIRTYFKMKVIADNTSSVKKRVIVSEIRIPLILQRILPSVSAIIIRNHYLLTKMLTISMLENATAHKAVSHTQSYLILATAQWDIANNIILLSINRNWKGLWDLLKSHK